MKRYLILFFIITMITTNITVAEELPVASNLYRKIGDFGSNSKHIKPNNMPDEDYYSKSNNDSSKFLSVFKNLFNQY